jgi:hypothetical protein
MHITIHASFLPHDDPDASLGFEVRDDVGYAGLRWITIGRARPAGHVHRPAAPRHWAAASPTRSAV